MSTTTSPPFTSPPFPSPNLSSPYDLTGTPTSEDDSWQYLDYSSTPGSVGFLPSPASGSLNGYAVVGHLPPAESPLYLDLDQPQYPVGSGSMSGASVSGGMVDGDGFVVDDVVPFGAAVSSFLTPQDLLLTDAQMNEIGLFNDFSNHVALPAGLDFRQQPGFGISQAFPPPDVTPWDPTSLPPEQILSPTLADLSSSSSSLQSSPALQPTPGKAVHHLPTQRGVQAGKVEKRKRRDRAAPATATDQAGKFVIMTPTSITAQAGRPNPFECFEEAMRTSHKGRKGPLANATKESALQVRRLGACFCCHSRKVKCDKERPCRNCVKLVASVPQVMCWQFQDFLPVLFPGFVRDHFRREEMARFMDENVGGFGGDGGSPGRSCSVELFSGLRFRSVLVIPGASFFTAKTSEVLTHWHLHSERAGVDLRVRGAVPLGLDPAGPTQRDELRKRAKAYVQGMLGEPAYAEQLTETFRHTGLPRMVLQAAQRYWARSESPVVRRALSVYTYHYVLTRHLCMTRASIVSLADTDLVPQNVPWVTPRVLNRQVKAVMDDLMQRETQLVFDLFSKSLKPKSRREWAPCLAAFLVLCLLMESVETAADTFVVAQDEIRTRAGEGPPGGGKEPDGKDGPAAGYSPPRYERSFALRVNEEIEKLPFRQFAYQFHQVYQTHSKDSAARAFNPLVDDDFAEAGVLDSAGVELVQSLRGMLEGPSWGELDYLTMDPTLSNLDSHPFPRDVAFNYTGRLVSKFLLSFTDEKYIFDQT